MKRSIRSLFLAAALTTVSYAAALAEVTYNRGNSADPESLDPHKTSTVYEAHVLRDLFTGLTAQDAKANVIPGAAESWTVSPDGKVYTFKLRADGKWSDGSPVTADDFVFSWRRLLDQKTAAEYAYMLYPVVNGQAVNKGEKKPEELGIKALDDHTLEVTLNAATPYFLEMLTHQSTYAVSKANVEKLGPDFVKPGNLVSNGMDGPAHRLLRGDVLSFVKRARRREDRFDLVVLDPPSFGTRRHGTFSVERDYGRVAEDTLALVAPGGRLVAVTNHIGTSRRALHALIENAAASACVRIHAIQDLSMPPDHVFRLNGEAPTKTVVASVLG